MRCSRVALPAGFSIAMLVVTAAVARAQVLVAPVGGRSIPLPPGVVACAADHAGAGGWQVEAQARRVRPPAAGDRAGQLDHMLVAPRAEDCSTTTTSLALLSVGPPPSVDVPASAVEVDAGRALVRGKGLRGTVLRWRGGTIAGEDVCGTPEPDGDAERCAFAIGHPLPADVGLIDLIILPAGTHAGSEQHWFDAQGARLDAPGISFHPGRVLVRDLVPADAAVDLHGGEAQVSVHHIEAIAQVECTDAICALDGDHVAVRSERGGDDRLEMRVRLRPHAALIRGAGGETSPSFALAIQRCPVEIVSAPPLRGVAEQTLVAKLGGKCASDGGVRLSAGGRALPLLKQETEGGALYLVATMDRVEGDQLRVVAERNGSVVGSAQTRTLAPGFAASRLELADGRPLDFIPTNRPATLLSPVSEGGGVFVPISVPGAYRIMRGSDGRFAIQGAEGAAGSIGIRFAYRDPRLPGDLKDIDLGVVSELVQRPLRPAAVPVALMGESNRAPLVELLCGDGQGTVAAVPPGVTRAVPFRARDTCQLRLHRERLTVEDGEQDLRIQFDVLAADGTAHAQGRREKRLLLSRAEVPLTLFASGIDAPFDRLTVEVAHAGGESTVDVAEAQWSIIFGTERARIYATATIPTGLFRVADDRHSGLLTLNAGGLFRLVHLDQEGGESPLGLEGGVMWLGIPGDTDATGVARGQVVGVAGVGLGVPIANRARSAQTSINLHLWVEYEVSRRILGQPGSAVGLVFGPSLSIGDVGSNL